MKEKIIVLGTPTSLSTPTKLHYHYRWQEDNTDTCAMAVILNEKIIESYLTELLNKNTITAKEYRAIQHLDMEEGTEYDLEVIKKLAERNGHIVEVIT